MFPRSPHSDVLRGYIFWGPQLTLIYIPLFPCLPFIHLSTQTPSIVLFPPRPTTSQGRWLGWESGVTLSRVVAWHKSWPRWSCARPVPDPASQKAPHRVPPSFADHLPGPVRGNVTAKAGVIQWVRWPFRAEEGGHGWQGLAPETQWLCLGLVPAWPVSRRPVSRWQRQLAAALPWAKSSLRSQGGSSHMPPGPQRQLRFSDPK